MSTSPSAKPPPSTDIMSAKPPTSTGEPALMSASISCGSRTPAPMAVLNSSNEE